MLSFMQFLLFSINGRITRWVLLLRKLKGTANIIWSAFVLSSLPKKLINFFLGNVFGNGGYDITKTKDNKNFFDQWLKQLFT